MITAEKFLELTAPSKYINAIAGMHYIRPRAACADGFSVSIQANNSAYCTPRRWDSEKYFDVELGFPIEPDDIIKDYAENSDDPKNTVYPFVPMYLVEKLVEKHGGIIGCINIDDNTVVKFDESILDD